ncbi:MAG: TetR family transcriptional regulator [Halioglobus sp.]|nr:TetR family transcriptional regulator [Halioglobus sp.]
MTATAAKQKPQSPRVRRAKGEQTRLKILQAVLEVIAREGMRGVTHRAVAAEAGVQLSLTTYYFRDIEEVIYEAFCYFSRQSRPDLDVLWGEVFAYLDGFSAAQLRRAAVRETICEELAQRAADYMTAQIVDKPVGLAVEQILFTHTRLSDRLRRIGEVHRRHLLEPLETLCSRFNSDDPQIDAELLLNTITMLEYQALSIPRDRIDRQHLLRLLRRHIGWVLGLKRK